MEFILHAGFLIWMAIVSLISNDADAAEFSRTSISYLAGDGYVTGEHQRNVISFDAIRKTEKTLIYANVDLQSFTDKASNPVSRVVLHLNDGLHVAGQLQNSAGYSNANIGFGYDYFNSSGFFGFDVYRRVDSSVGDGSYVFVFSRYSISSSIYFDGFIDLSIPDKGQQQLLTQPSLMYNFDKNTSIGIEYQIYLNKGYVIHKDEYVPQLKINFGW